MADLTQNDYLISQKFLKMYCNNADATEGTTFLTLDIFSMWLAKSAISLAGSVEILVLRTALLLQQVVGSRQHDHVGKVVEKAQKPESNWSAVFQQQSALPFF